MATDFNYSNKTVEMSGPIKPSIKNAPGDARTRVETYADIATIPVPYVGMIITVLADETNEGKMTDYKVKSLKASNLGLPNSLVDEVVRYADYLGVTSGGGAGEAGSKGDTGTTFTPSVDENGDLSWTNDGNLENPTTVNIKGAKGEQGDTGTTFTPSVSSEGDLSWTNDGELENPSPVNIKGPQGEKGEKGDTGTTFTPSVSSEGILSWTNNGELDNPSSFNIKGPQGEKGEKGDPGETTNVVLKEDLKVTGVTVGSFTDGTVIKADTDVLSILKAMLIKRIAATYKAPELSISSSITSAELGSTISPKLTITYKQNDAGEVSNFTLSKNNSELENQSTVLTTYTDSSLLLDGTKTYSASVTYEDGEIKQDNLGNDSPDGRIESGTKTTSVTISTYRNSWAFSTSDCSTPEDASFIRSFTGQGNKTNGGTMKISASATDQMVLFAYPATLRECTKIRYEEANDDGNKTAFTYTTVSIPDASGNNAIDYRVYYYIGAVQFGATMTFTMTI